MRSKSASWHPGWQLPSASLSGASINHDSD